MVRSVFLPFLVATIAILSHVAQAIRFSYPTSAGNAHSVDLSIVKGDTLNVTWDTVSTDPKKFSLYLWEFAAYPPAYELVAYNVDTEAKQATFKVPCNIKSSPDWQLYEHKDLAHGSNQRFATIKYLLIGVFITEP